MEKKYHTKKQEGHQLTKKKNTESSCIMRNSRFLETKNEKLIITIEK